MYYIIELMGGGGSKVAYSFTTGQWGLSKFSKYVFVIVKQSLTSVTF